MGIYRGTFSYFARPAAGLPPFAALHHLCMLPEGIRTIRCREAAVPGGRDPRSDAIVLDRSVCPPCEFGISGAIIAPAMGSNRSVRPNLRSLRSWRSADWGWLRADKTCRWAKSHFCGCHGE